MGAAAGALPLAVPPLHVPHVLAQLAFTAGCFVQRPLVFAMVQVIPIKLKPALSPQAGACRTAGGSRTRGD